MRMRRPQGSLCRANMQLLGLLYLRQSSGATAAELALQWRDLGNRVWLDANELIADLSKRLNHLHGTMCVIDKGEMHGRYRRYILNDYGLMLLTAECERLDALYSPQCQTKVELTA